MAECSAHKLVADVAVLAKDSVLMVKYRDTSKYDGQSGWFLPDDYLAHLEHPEDGVNRILREQAGLEASSLALDHIESFGDGAWHLVFHFKAELEALPEVNAGENVAEIRWFALDSLPEESEVAHHGWCLDVLDEIRRKRG